MPAKTRTSTPKPDVDTKTEVVDGEVLEGEVKDEPTELAHGFVEFRGRTIEVQAPSIEQIVIIRRLQKTFADTAKLKEIDAEEAVRLMDRALKAITSITVNPGDVDFVEDLWLERKMDLEETLPLLTTSMRTLEAANTSQVNRAQRRAAEKKSQNRSGRATLVTS